MAIDATFLMKLRDVARAMLDHKRFEDYLGILREADGEKIEKKEAKPVTEIMEVAAERFGFTQNEGLKVMENLISEGARGSYSKYGFSNAVTRAAEDAETYDRAVELERIGGQVIEMERGDWESIWKVKN